MTLFSFSPRLVATLACFALAAACTEPTTAKPDAAGGGATDEDTEDGGTVDPDGGPGDGAGDSGTTTKPDGDTSTTTTDGTPGDVGEDGAIGDVDATVDPDAAPDATVDAETASGGSDVAAETGPPKPKLPLPDCAGGAGGNCLTACPEGKLCVDGTTYFNDCEAIFKLKAFDWPAGYETKIKKGACPDCKDCANVEVKCNLQNGTNKCTLYQPGKPAEESVKSCSKNADCVGSFEGCATLKSGAKVAVELPCQAKCMDLTTTETPYVAGKCKSGCSQPPPNGGGCPMNVYQPVCAKEDGKTYATPCALKNCDKQGCYGLGLSQKSDTCEPDKLTKECDGECFAEASKVSASAANCPKDCNPVCGILPTGKGQSYRNACLATNANAKVADCKGISATPKDKCSAAELYQGKGCCADVDYVPVNPVCASKPAAKTGDPDVWITFRSQAEYKCLTAGDNSWVPQYSGPCICNCPNTYAPVCGDDGLTYVNKCQAECYNGPSFNVKSGPC